jgi:hypothetical protein
LGKDVKMFHSINIAGLDCRVEYDYKVTVKACGPAYSRSGELISPPEPMEYELTFINLWGDLGAVLECPEWLRNNILEVLYNSDSVYEAIEEAEQ